MVEMAIILPLFVILAMGLMEFGRAFLVDHAMATAAREGARLAVVTRDLASNQNDVIARICGELESANVACNNVAITITPAAQRGDPVTVRLQHNLAFITGAAVNMIGLPGTLALDKTCTMRDEVSPRT